RKAAVALKTFTHGDAKSMYDFKNEFRLLADLSHPNLVSLYELFGDERSWHIAMELVPGTDLITYVRQTAPDPATYTAAGRAAVPCDLARLGGVMTQLCHALTYLHGAGKLHCDIKPSNVLVTAHGTLKLVDFGLVTDTSTLLTDAARRIRG